jgi:hypothetical protein
MPSEKSLADWTLLLWSVRGHDGYAVRHLANCVAGAYLETVWPSNVQTAFGADFTCIARSIFERGFDKAVIVTDDYATMSDELKVQLMKCGLLTCTIPSADVQACDDFREVGEVARWVDASN